MNLATRNLGLMCRIAALLAALSAGPAGRALAAEQKASADPIVELPKFVVTDSRELPEPEQWRYATASGLEIISSASDRATQRLVSDFLMFREALDVMWPMPATLNTPVSLIVCGKGRQFESLVPKAADAGADVATASLYLRGPTRSVIAIDLAAKVINLMSLDIPVDASTTTGEDPTQFSIDHNKQLYREYVRYLLSRSQPRLPAWFEEGMSQIIMGMQFTPQWIEFGRIHDANTVSAAAGNIAQMNAAATAQAGLAEMGDTEGSAGLLGGAPAEDRDFNAALARRALMPMGKLFAVLHSDAIAQNPLGNNVWAKQCFAFVHMCLYGDRGRYQKAFGNFLMRATREPVTEELFKQCFDMSYKDMGITLRGYIQFTSYKSLIAKSKDGKPFLREQKLEFRDATPAEIGRIKSTAKLLAGYTDAARTELIAPYIRGERDPQLLAALGLIERVAGKHDRARKFLITAVAGKCTDPEAYIELARYYFEDATAKPGATEGRFSAAQVDQIRKLLLTAASLPPPKPGAFELLADTLTKSASRPVKADVYPLLQAVQVFPNRLRLVYQTAALSADAGLAEAAHSLVEHGLKYAPDTSARGNFERLKAALPPLPAPASAPAAVPATAPRAG